MDKIGVFLGALVAFYWYYRDTKKQLEYIHELEQTLNDNKIWIKS